ncbi:hydroxymethylbilane synthase [Haloparvum sedimenti]|uniref:hydroxymethylbilane synthase n=1 Tax=Haloparvum sedimenti TaxID=1678448 RepID=UPI00071E9D22|nr:hydroxymethylbilane synthase [Haloparvum sedimenti]
MTDTLRLVTRGSDLARRQAATVRETLESHRREVDIREVETRGDRIPDELIHRLGKTGAFVRALDEEVIDGDADIAVHSLKDVPTEDADDLVVAAVPERAPAGDVLLSPDGTDLKDLEPGSVVGTASLRRTAQIKAARPDLEVEPIRGNVDTRIEKLIAPGLQREHEARVEAEADEKGAAGDDGAGEGGDADAADGEFAESVDEWFDGLSELERSAMGREVETEYDALVLAEAGLRRSNLYYEVPTQRLPRGEFVPAAGQGALAVTAADPDVAETVRRALDHPRSRVAVTTERTILEELNGGCIAPIGVSALVQGEYVKTTVRVLSTDGTEEVAETRDLRIDRHAQEAESFAADLREDGAAELVAAAREAADATGAGTDGGTPDDE